MADFGTLYGHIFNNMKDGICIISMTGHVEYMNESALNILKVQEENYLEDRLINIIPTHSENDEFLQLVIDSIFDKDEAKESIVDFKRDETYSCKLRVNTSYIEDGQDSGIIIIITDLTELFKANSAFARYTSPDIADIVLHTPEGGNLGGKNKDVTIMISDLRGFTSISTKMSAQELISMINHYFLKMSEVISKYKGTIIEFLGDGIFAVFGAPKDNPNHAADAVACAIEMQLAMEEVNKWNAKNGYPSLQAGIGINTGEAVVGNIGSENTMKYGCLGEQVNIAGRTEALTTGGQIIITENTLNLIDDDLDIISENRLKPKGASTEINVYQVGGIGGKYGFKVKNEEASLTKITPLNIDFAIVVNKTVQPERFPAVITEISDRFALITTDYSLTKSTDIFMDIDGDLYAKTVEEKESGYVICFTSTPNSFENWIKSLTT